MRREVLVIEEAFEQHVRVCARPEMHYYYYYYYYRARGGDGGQGGQGGKHLLRLAVFFLRSPHGGHGTTAAAAGRAGGWSVVGGGGVGTWEVVWGGQWVG